MVKYLHYKKIVPINNINVVWLTQDGFPLSILSKSKDHYLSTWKIERFVSSTQDNAIKTTAPPRFLYYFSAYVNLFKERLFFNAPGGSPLKSGCKGMLFYTTIQIIIGKNFKINIRLRFKVDTDQLWYIYTLLYIVFGCSTSSSFRGREQGARE